MLKTHEDLLIQLAALEQELQPHYPNHASAVHEAIAYLAGIFSARLVPEDLSRPTPDFVFHVKPQALHFGDVFRVFNDGGKRLHVTIAVDPEKC